MKSESLIRDVYCELVDQDRIKELCPLIRTDDLQGGLWIPGDGVANPFEICLALSVLAHRAGAKIVQVAILPIFSFFVVRHLNYQYCFLFSMIEPELGVVLSWHGIHFHQVYFG